MINYNPKTEKLIVTEIACKVTQGLTISFVDTASNTMLWRNVQGDKLTNPINGSGEMAAISVAFMNQDQSEIDILNDGVRTALAQVRNRATLELSFDSSQTFSLPLHQIMKPMPWVVTHGIIGTMPTSDVAPPPSVIQPVDMAMGESQYGKYSKDFITPPSSLSGYPAVCNQVAANCQEG